MLNSLSWFFFLTSNGHSITQTWGGQDNQTGIDQPMKSNSLQKVLAVLAKNPKTDCALVAHGWFWSPGNKYAASLSSPILSQILATFGVPLPLQSTSCSLFQSSGMTSVGAYSPSPSVVLPPPNAMLIHIEWNSVFPYVVCSPHYPSRPIHIH